MLYPLFLFLMLCNASKNLLSCNVSTTLPVTVLKPSSVLIVGTNLPSSCSDCSGCIDSSASFNVSGLIAELLLTATCGTATCELLLAAELLTHELLLAELLL